MNNLNKSAKETLKRLIDQIERLDGERRGIAEDIKDKFKEAKDSGFDVAIMRKVLALRRKDKAEVEEEQAIIDTYLQALGWESTPLGRVLEAAE